MKTAQEMFNLTEQTMKERMEKEAENAIKWCETVAAQTIENAAKQCKRAHKFVGIELNGRERYEASNYLQSLGYDIRTEGEAMVVAW